VWALDRFTRNGMAATVVDLQRLASYGVSFHSYCEPRLSTDNELVRDALLMTDLGRARFQVVGDFIKVLSQMSEHIL
jgi:hypothetical protein